MTLNIGNISITTPYGIKDNDNLDAMDLYVVHNILAFKIDTLVMTGILEEFQHNSDKMEEMSRMTRRWNAQMSNMTQEQLASGVYVDDNGDLVSNLTYLEAEQDQTDPITENLGEGIGPVSRSFDLVYGDTQFNISYTIQGDSKSGFKYEFEITVGAHFDKKKQLDGQGSKEEIEGWESQTYTLTIDAEERASFETAVSKLLEHIKTELAAHWGGDDNAKHALHNNNSAIYDYALEHMQKAYAAQSSSLPLSQLKLNGNALTDQFTFKLGSTVIVVDYQIKYDQAEDKFQISFTNVQLTTHYAKSHNSAGMEEYIDDYKVDTEQFSDADLAALNAHSSSLFDTNNYQNSLEKAFENILEMITARVNGSSFGDQKFREQVRLDLNNNPDLSHLFVASGYQDVIDGVYGASQEGHKYQPNSPSLVGHMRYTSLTASGNEVDISGYYEIFGNAQDGYTMNLTLTLTYEEGGATKTEKIQLLNVRLGEEVSLNDIMDKALFQLQDKFRNLDGYNSEIFNHLKDNQLVIRNQLTGELLNGLGDKARGIDALFETTSLGSQFNIENSGLIEIPVMLQGLQHYYRVFWEYDNATGVIKFDLYIRTDHSEGSGDSTKLIGDYEINTNPDETQVDFWKRALLEIFDAANQAFSERIENENGETNWRFFEHLYGGNTRSDKYVTGKDNLAVAIALWSEERDEDYWHNRHKDKNRGSQQKSSWKEQFTQVLDEMRGYFIPERLESMAHGMPFVSYAGTDGEIADAPYRPSEVGELLEEAIGDPSLYQNGRAYSKEHLSTIVSRLEDVIANIGNTNNMVLQRLRRHQENATARLQMIVQDLQREYQSNNTIFGNMA